MENKARRRGRPVRHEDDRRDKIVNVRMTEFEYQMLLFLTSESGYSTSEIIRMQVRKAYALTISGHRIW